MPDNIPDGITREDVLAAIADFDGGIDHDFAPSTIYDLLYKNRRYPPKAILGLAARRLAGRKLSPGDFKAGEQSKCFRVLRGLGFDVVPKEQAEQQTVKRNPAWQRDELILALDFYFRHPPKTVSQTHPAVLELSDLLNALPIHADRPDDARFRNPNGVYMKLGNFLRFDPDYQGTGLSRGGKLEEVIWNEFSGDRHRLHQLANMIAQGFRSVPTEVQLEDEDESEFPEGRVLYRLHRQRERNSKLITNKKNVAESLACEVCGFDFFATYGAIGDGYIECHHTVPISEYAPGQKTKLEDLVLVCANCHRMLHRRRPWLSAVELRLLIGIE